MAILKSNLINGQKPEFGNPKHIQFVKKLEAIREGTRPIVEDHHYEIVCKKLNDPYNCIMDCNCDQHSAKFNCINCNKEHRIVTGPKISLSVIGCSCGFTYSELMQECENEIYLISDGSEDNHL